MHFPPAAVVDGDADGLGELPGDPQSGASEQTNRFLALSKGDSRGGLESVPPKIAVQEAWLPSAHPK